MKRKTVYTDPGPEINEAIERSVRVKDTLPPPSYLRALVEYEESEKIGFVKFPKKAASFFSGKVAAV